MERTEWDVRYHKVVFEPPDICHIYVNGPAPIEDNRASLAIAKEIEEKVGAIFMVAHLSSGLEGFTNESRKFFAGLRPNWKALIVIGGNAITRTALNIAAIAIQVLSGLKFAIRMVKTEEDARAVMNDIRAKAEAAKAKVA